MRTSFGPLLGLIIALSATPAFAEDATDTPAITISGTAAVVSDYRFRGLSQTDKNFAVQGSITVAHESGLYVSVWGSSVSGYVAASANVAQEIDLIAGYKKSFGATTLDVGALYYFYPRSNGFGTSSDFIEPYASVAHTFGPATAKVSVAYAPKQKALSTNGQAGTVADPAKENFYFAGDLSGTIPNTPIGLSAHLGHTFGPSWLVPQGLSATKNKGYTDWGVGVSYTYKVLTFGVNYVDTDANPYTPVSAKNDAKGGLVFSLTASF